ncbi:MAG: alpha/beta hydrolase-fold protein [Gemmatimonadales bacterium]
MLGRHLVILGPGGLLAAAEANPHGYVEKARLRVLDRGSLAAPSIADGRILVRNHTHIASVAVTESTRGEPRRTVETDPRLAESEFAAFVHRVKAASDKKVLIDDFIASHERFPVVEGDGLVHFVYHGPVDDIALLGSMTDWEASDPMERISGTDFYYKSYALEPGGRWEYLFNLNFDKYVTDPLNPRRSPGDWQEVSEVATPGWVEPRHLDEPVGARGSTESFRFESEILANEREVKVYLPSAYSTGRQRYPLLVVNNGVRVLELIKMDHSLDNLIGKSVAPLIVAFVGTPAEAHESWQEGGPPSYKEYGGLHTGMHARMLAEELVPRLDHTYRTLHQPEAKAVMGIGSAGLTALYAALHHSTVFGKVAVQSLRPGPTPLQSSSFRPRPFWDALLVLLQEKEPLPVQIYLDWARSELRSAEQDIDLRRDNGNLFRLLQEKGYTVGGGEYPGGPGWGSWQARTDKVLMALFPVQRED